METARLPFLLRVFPTASLKFMVADEEIVP
jgi:hypothetical protein